MVKEDVDDVKQVLKSNQERVGNTRWPFNLTIFQSKYEEEFLHQTYSTTGLRLSLNFQEQSRHKDWGDVIP